MEEIWRDIEGYVGIYKVSNYGKVMSVERYSPQKHLLPQKFLNGYDNGNGYTYVDLYNNGKRSKFSIHRLVAEAFIDNPNGLKCVNHKDEDRSNNHVSNLEWCTYGYNCNYGNHKDKLSKARKGKCKGINNVGSKKVVCVTTGDVFDCIKDASEYYNIQNSRTHIHKVCEGKFKFVGRLPDGTKLVWAWYEDYFNNKEFVCNEYI